MFDEKINAVRLPKIIQPEHNPAPDFIVTLEATAIPKIGSESEELLLEKDNMSKKNKRW